MPKKTRTQKQLVTENKNLNARLDEAEETLRAIRCGEVDALVVLGEGGEQIFTLKGVDRSYRVLIEEMNEGALILTAEGVILYANRRFAEMLKTPLEKVIGSTIHTWIAPDRQRILQALLQKGADEQRCEELALTASDGTQVPVYLSVNRLLVDEIPNSLCLVATDLTEHKHNEEIVAAETSARASLEQSERSRRVLLSMLEDQKHAEEALRRRLAELEALHTASTALRTAQTRDEALPILLDETLTALETDAGAIWLYHADSGELHAAVNRGWFRQFEEMPMKLGDGIAGTVFASGQAYITAAFGSDPLVRQPVVGQFPAGWGGVCLPIRAGAKTVGTLTVSLPPPRQITTEQVKLLELLTEMAGITLHRMSLHEETVRQLDFLEALHSIDIAISASMDLRMTLNVLLEHVKTQLNADATRVLLLNPHSQILEYAAGRGFRTHTVQNAHIRLGEDVAGRAALERRTFHADDPAQILESPHFAALWASEGFAAYSGVPLIAKGEVKGVLEVYHRAPFHPRSDWISFLDALAGQAAIAIESAQLFENLEHSNTELILAYDTTIEGWSDALDLRDKETEGHTLRVTEITLRLAKAMGISDAELVHLRRGALLHDIGKMGVPDSILLKPGKLTDEEWKLMRLHPQLAYNLISPINYLRAALDIPYCHHEKWDGTGYPRGLKGQQIPQAARIFAVVDVWDALRSDRPYRAAWAAEKARENIVENIGKHFDPEVVKAFLTLLDSGGLIATDP